MKRDTPGPAPRSSASPESCYLEFLRAFLRGSTDGLAAWCREHDVSEAQLSPLHRDWEPLLEAIAPAGGLSTFAAERIGSNWLRVKDGDLILYDAVRDTAAHYFQEQTFRTRNGAPGGAADIDAVSFWIR